ncbi:MAG: ATP-dependent DNA ligase [Thermoplasmata archaeon]|nr:ATP-dependent DNA ligase [Thermoplasmata archaeon]MCI4359167.1 ATP-dependent DNA ligase [Thermoplasmata archaeon]
MKYADLVAAYERLDATTKRTELRDVLAELVRSSTIGELPAVLFLSQGQLRPEYEGVELGVADSLARRAVAEATGVEAPEVLVAQQRSGDLGLTVEELKLRNARSASTPALSVAEVYEKLRAVADARGAGSQEVKVQALVELLARSEPVEAKYLVRFVLGQLRLGVREMTILDALAVAFGDGTKESRRRIEDAFNVSSDLGLVAQTISKGGLDALASIHLEVGRPIRPMLAERSPDLADVLKRMEGAAALEMKYDGLRVQAHIATDGSVRLFSRRLEEIGDQFPELRPALAAAVQHRPAIVEGECVAVDSDTDEIRPFQEISRRRGRKYDLERMQSEIPVSIFLFDVLLDGTTETATLPFPDRRRSLERLIVPGERVRLADQQLVHSVEEAQAYFDRCIAAGGEGVMAKSLAPESAYRAGARGFWWIKYKREYTHGLADSVDGVVVGAFYGKGRRAGRYGALLMAVYDPDQDQFETFCKVGSGFDDATLQALPARLTPFELDSEDPKVRTSLTADRWMRPGLVLEIRGAELTLSPTHPAALGKLRVGFGLALRFPRFTGRFRDDKGPTDATTAQELVRLYQSQVKQASPEEPSA